MGCLEWSQAPKYVFYGELELAVSHVRLNLTVNSRLAFSIFQARGHYLLKPRPDDKQS
jgi:hypothetical protein